MLVPYYMKVMGKATLFLLSVIPAVYYMTEIDKALAQNRKVKLTTKDLAEIPLAIDCVLHVDGKATDYRALVFRTGQRVIENPKVLEVTEKTKLKWVCTNTSSNDWTLWIDEPVEAKVKGKEK